MYAGITILELIPPILVIMGLVLLAKSGSHEQIGIRISMVVSGIISIMAGLVLIAIIFNPFTLLLLSGENQYNQEYNRGVPIGSLSQTYANSAYGFQINYPKNFRLVEGDISGSSFDYAQPVKNYLPASSSMLATIEMPTSTFPPGDGFFGAFVSISVDSMSNASDCLEFAGAPGNVGIVTFGDIPFSADTPPASVE